MTRAICFASAKGGSGKTVVAASLARLLSGLGKKVLLIDADAATNGLTLLYLEELVKAKEQFKAKHLQGLGLFDYGPTKIKELQRRGLFIPDLFAVAGVDIIPATYVLKPTKTIDAEVFELVLSAIVAVSKKEYDYIFIDTQAGSDEFARLSMKSADETIIVSEFDPISSEGVDRLRHLFPEELSYNRTWILFNKILPEFAASIGDLLTVARYLNPIPWDADVVRAFSHKRLAIDLDQGNAFTLGVMRTLESLLGPEIKAELDAWRTSKAESIREPARLRLNQLEGEIAATEKALIDASFKTRYSRRRVRTLQEFIITSVVIFATLLLGVSSIFSLFPINSLLWTVLFAAILIIAATYLTNFFLQNRIRSQEEHWEELRRSLERRLTDLAESRQKYKAMVDSDLETKRRP